MLKWILIMMGSFVGSMLGLFVYCWIFTGLLQFQDGSNGALLGASYVAAVQIICTIIILKKIDTLKK